MNEQQLAKIEERWLAASGGPWCLEDYSVPEGKRRKNMTTAQALERWQRKRDDPRNDGKDVPLQTLSFRTYEDFLRLWPDGTREEWIKWWEESLYQVDGDLAEQCFAMIYPCKRAALDEGNGAWNQGMPRELLRSYRHTKPALAVLTPEAGGAARKEDIDFVIHAPEDVGLLLTEVRALREKIAGDDDQIERLKHDLKASREQVAEGNKLLSQLRAHAETLRKVASAILDREGVAK